MNKHIARMQKITEQATAKVQAGQMDVMTAYREIRDNSLKYINDQLTKGTITDTDLNKVIAMMPQLGPDVVIMKELMARHESEMRSMMNAARNSSPDNSCAGHSASPRHC